MRLDDIGGATAHGLEMGSTRDGSDGMMGTAGMGTMA
jgi:hypothetical protein